MIETAYLVTVHFADMREHACSCVRLLEMIMLLTSTDDASAVASPTRSKVRFLSRPDHVACNSPGPET